MKLSKILSIILIILLKFNENNFEFYIKHILDIKKISVIIPIFNNEYYLVDCLNTVINQTLENIEIICIDDGSTDNSSLIAKLYSELDKRIISLTQVNQGSGISRNRGIKYSKGKYISFMDSDDLYYDNFALQNLYDAAIKNKALICGGGIRKFKEINDTIIINDTLFENEGFITFMDYQYDFDYQRFIYNKNFLKRNKINFPRYLRYQDPPFFIKSMAIAKRFYAIKNITHKYRRRYKNLNLKQVIDMFYGFRDCLKLEEKFHLYKLYNLTLNRINTELFIKRVKKFRENKELKDLILKVLKSINTKLLTENNFNFTIDKFYQDITYNFSNKKYK